MKPRRAGGEEAAGGRRQRGPAVRRRGGPGVRRRGEPRGDEEKGRDEDSPVSNSWRLFACGFSLGPFLHSGSSLNMLVLL